MKKFLRFVYRLLLVSWLLGMVVAGGWFATENPQALQPLFFGYSLPKASAGLYLVVALGIGIGLGFFISFILSQGRSLKVRRDIGAKNKEIKKLQAKIPQEQI